MIFLFALLVGLILLLGGRYAYGKAMNNRSSIPYGSVFWELCDWALFIGCILIVAWLSSFFDLWNIISNGNAQLKTAKDVSSFLDDWKYKLYLNEWDLSAKIVKHYHHHGSNILASIHVDTTYLWATIQIHPNFFKRSKDIQEHLLVHELCHIFSTPLDHIARDLSEGVSHHKHHLEEANEQLTQRIANIAYYGLQKKKG